MEDLVESILDYIRSDYTDYAIMINGEWGSGKHIFGIIRLNLKLNLCNLMEKDIPLSICLYMVSLT